MAIGLALVYAPEILALLRGMPVHGDLPQGRWGRRGIGGIVTLSPSHRGDIAAVVGWVRSVRGGTTAP